MEQKSRARVLRKSVRYPAYQLSAAAESKKETPEQQMVIGVLSVLEWLRTKFQEFDIPEAFQTPPPEEYQKVRLADLKNAHIDAGYTVETVCVPEEQVWAFRLIEPDLSTKVEDGKEISTALPGRIFETNVAFRVSGKTLRCGVSVIVAEPEDTDVSRRAFALRPAVVQKLAANPKLGLESGYRIKECVWELNNRDRIKQLKSYLDTGVVPAVIFCDCLAAQEAQEELAALTVQMEQMEQMEKNRRPWQRLPLSQAARDAAQMQEMMERLKKSANPVPSGEGKALTDGVRYDLDYFSGARMGYVHCFHLPASQFAAFEKVHALAVSSGEILFLETKGMGGGLTRYPYRREEKEEAFAGVMEKSRDYFLQKPLPFEDVAFLTDAKRLMMERYDKAHLSARETAELYEKEIELLEQKYQNALREKDGVTAKILDDREKKIDRLEKKLNEEYDRMKHVREEAEERVRQIQGELEAKEEKVEYYKGLLSRPKTPQEIPAWVETRFSDRLGFCPRAVTEIQKVPVQDINMPLLCDAIEYLAMEYRDLRSGAITEEEAQRRSAEKYDRPFQVGGCGVTNIEMFSDEYSAEYQNRKVTLSDHLRCGNTTPYLVRIYFCYDKNEKKIIVGSLPDHLSTSKISG